MLIVARSIIRVTCVGGLDRRGPCAVAYARYNVFDALRFL